MDGLPSKIDQVQLSGTPVQLSGIEIQRMQQQQLRLEQQRQDELLRLQQTALAEKRREEQELFHLQQEALREKQKDNAKLSELAPSAAMVPPPSLEFATGTVPAVSLQPTTPIALPVSTPGASIPPPPGIELNFKPTELTGPPGTELPVDVKPSLPALLTLVVDNTAPQAVDTPPPALPVREVRLPVALEQALAFKAQRAQQLGLEPHQLENIELAPLDTVSATSRPFADYGDDDDDDEDEDVEAEKKSQFEAGSREMLKQSKNKRKKKRKKMAKLRQLEEAAKKVELKDENDKEKENQSEPETKPDVEIEYIQETLGLYQLEPMYRQFAKIFETFRISEPEKIPDLSKEFAAVAALGAKSQADLKKIPKLPDEFEEEMDETEGKAEDKKPKLSKRKLKKLTRLSVAELKQLVSRPDVVEMHDVTARDPKLLVQLKAHRNTVPVPRHWCFKRKYLQGKRGIEKLPFDLPDFIKKTGIMEMRASLQEKEDQRTLKAKMRERARPKMGKIDIDYQKLHDAFFKWQTKPRLTIHGDLYYEGKEFETRLKEKKPGDLSTELRTALGMPIGPNANKIPPPWLIAMQRYGPPPSYPNLKIPGLNAPIPEGTSFGYHAGGWGKPPVDETGKPLYGDVFGTQNATMEISEADDDIDKTAWGELESESESESSEEEDDEGGEEVDEKGLVTPAEGLITPSGITSAISAGMETPENIELRKRKIESDMEGGETPALYQVLAEKRVDRVGGAMMASTHVYDVAPGGGAGVGVGGVAQGAGGGPRKDTVEVALDPSELDLVDTEAMAARYEQQMREQQSQLQKEDLSDMLAEHVARQKSKRKRQQTQENKQSKRYKEFKF